MAITEKSDLLQDIIVERRNEERRVTDRRREERRSMDRRRQERRKSDRRGLNRRRGDRRSKVSGCATSAPNSLLTVEERETVLKLVSKLLEQSEPNDN